MKYSIVVPCYNEEKNIANLVQHFQIVSEQLRDEGVELILVNNGSNDNTQSVIDQVMKENAFVKTVHVPVNQGYGYGILQGLREGKGEYLGWIHADLQIEPNNFLKMIELLESESVVHKDKVFMRGRRHNRPITDRIFTFGMSCFETMYLGCRLWDINAQPTLMHRSLFDDTENPPYDFSLDLFFYYMAKRKNYQIIRIPVEQQERTEGESSWNTGMRARIKLIKRTLLFSKELKRNVKK